MESQIGEVIKKLDKPKTTPVAPEGKATPGTPKVKEPAEAGKKTWFAVIGDAGTVKEPTEAEKKTATAKLFKAVKASNASQVNEALEAGANINAKDSDGWTALMRASRNGYKAIVKTLLDKGADVNAKDKEGGTALMWATFKNRTAIVKILIDKGADVNARDNRGSTALMMAAINGHTDIVALLEAARAAIARLFIAVKANNASQVNEALEAGANINAKDSDGWTALMWALGEGYTAIAKALIDKKADVNAREGRGWTALMIAAGKGYKGHGSSPDRQGC